MAEYILRSPFSQEKLRYHATTGAVIYRSKIHPGLQWNFEIFSGCDRLAALTAHIPNAGEHLVRVLRLVQQYQSEQAPEGPGREPDNRRGIY